MLCLDKSRTPIVMTLLTESVVISVIRAPMKRSRQLVESRLEALRRKKARLDAQVEKLARDISGEEAVLEDMDLDEKEARAVTVPWEAYEYAARCSRKAWKEVDHGGDVYWAYRRCADPEHGCCWYGGHMDCLGRIHIYEIEPLLGPTTTLCDRCMDHCRSACAHPNPATVRVDPDDYEPDIADYLRKAARGEDVRRVKLKTY